MGYINKDLVGQSVWLATDDPLHPYPDHVSGKCMNHPTKHAFVRVQWDNGRTYAYPKIGVELLPRIHKTEEEANKAAARTKKLHVQQISEGWVLCLKPEFRK